MKAFSILQPWAWLIVHGHKDVENPELGTVDARPALSRRGADPRGKRFDQEGLDWVRETFPHIDLPRRLTEAASSARRASSIW